jgi:hypothetical protein
MLAGFQRRFDRFPGWTGLPADQFDQNIYIGGLGKADGVVVPCESIEVVAAVLGPGPRRNSRHPHRQAAPRLQQTAMGGKEIKHAGADRAQPGNANAQRICHDMS